MKFVFLPSDLNLSLGQDIFHDSTVELGELLVELAIREESLLEGIDGNLLVTKLDGDLLTIEASNIVVEWLTMTLLDVIEVPGELFKFLATGKLLNKSVRELSEGGDGIIG